MARRQRSVIPEQEFEEQLQRLIPNSEAADDFTLGAECVLSIDPTVGRQASESVWGLAHVSRRRAERESLLLIRRSERLFSRDPRHVRKDRKLHGLYLPSSFCTHHFVHLFPWLGARGVDSGRRENRH
jgi:hypothetical protein